MAAKLGPLLVIVGPTASGKSDLALELARKFNGEIICADSRTVYKSMDIGTAKPSSDDQASIPHHLLDIVDPSQKFTAADFKQLAQEAIADISSRGRLPIMVGGTGLYIDSVLFDYQFSAPDSERDEQNPRHLKPSSEPAASRPMRMNTLVIGLKVDREILKARITKRVDEMIAADFVDEVKKLSEQYGWEAEPLKAPGYRAVHEYLDGSIKLEDAKAQFIKNDLSLAKRQQTWFKRNKSIHWVTNKRVADDITTKFLNKRP